MKTTQTHNLIEVIDFCQKNGFHQAEIVGRWVWLSFEQKPNAEIRQKLKDFGFRWVHRRGRWAHNCGHYSRQGKGDPRLKYGAVPVDEIDVQQKISA